MYVLMHMQLNMYVFVKARGCCWVSFFYCVLCLHFEIVSPCDAAAFLTWFYLFVNELHGDLLCLSPLLQPELTVMHYHVSAFTWPMRTNIWVLRLA